MGSSPLTRGKPPHPDRLPRLPGLIPAHAGKTSPVWPTRSPVWAHPRSRGENQKMPGQTGQYLGSSPLTRGKPRRSCGPESLCAAHPRSRGENSWSSRRRKETTGSSPLTRGKHFLTCAFIAQIGQILESLELCASSESYSSPDAYATDALQGRVRSIGLAPRSSRGAS